MRFCIQLTNSHSTPLSWTTHMHTSGARPGLEAMTISATHRHMARPGSMSIRRVTRISTNRRHERSSNVIQYTAWVGGRPNLPARPTLLRLQQQTTVQRSTAMTGTGDFDGQVVKVCTISKQPTPPHTVPREPSVQPTNRLLKHCQQLNGTSAHSTYYHYSHETNV